MTICWSSSATLGYPWMLIAGLPAATQASLAALDTFWTRPPLWIEIFLPQRSVSDLMPIGLPVGTMTWWLDLK